MEKILEEYQLIQKGYGKNTINIYCKYFSDFYNYFHDECLSNLTKVEINKYILSLINSGAISASKQNQKINAIKVLL